MMLIKDLFTKPVSRPINGVIKADQFDDESVWQELDEYVITRELDIHLRRFISAYLESIDNRGNSDVSGKVGVWVSGFFGSGKSHFIKILSYLLENREVSKDGASKKAIEFFDGKIQDAMLAGDIKRAVGSDCDVILFNIDSKADSTGGRDAILRVFLKVLNEKLGYSGDHPHIAHMERYLDNAKANWSSSRKSSARPRGPTGRQVAMPITSTPTSWSRRLPPPWVKVARPRTSGWRRRSRISI